MKTEYSLRYANDGVHLTILTPMGKVFRDSIFDALRKKKINGLNEEAVEELLKNPNIEGKIALPQEEFLLNEEAKVRVSKDRLTAHISFTPADGGKLLTAMDIMERIRDAKITVGVNTEIIRSLAENPNKIYNTDIVIATGKPPINGVDGFVNIKFPVMRNKTPKLLENGTVDHKNVGGYNTVTKGDLLAELVPSTAGEDGIDVLGNPLKAKSGKPKAIPCGKFTALSEDSLRLFAAEDGYVEILNGKITVLKVMEIKGDVGPATGHIDFSGDVNITGNVNRLYNVTAGGTITIGGCVETSIIKAGADIVIKQGIKGMLSTGEGKCEVTAGGNVTAKFIENAVVKASGVIRADSIIHSFVTSNSVVEVKGKHGLIIGGKIYALKGIVCYAVGKSSGMSTVIDDLNVGITLDMRLRYTELKRQTEELTEKIESITAEIESRKIKNPNKLEKQKLLLEELEAQLYQTVKDQKEIRDAMRQINLGVIHIKNSMFPPVDVSIGMVNKRFESIENYVSLCLQDGTIVANPCTFNF